MEYKKAKISLHEVEMLLHAHFGAEEVLELKPLTGGNLSQVFSCNIQGSGYVIKFSDMEEAYSVERYIADLVAKQGIPYPKCVTIDKYNGLFYSIMERVVGCTLADLPYEQQSDYIPELIRILTSFHHVDISGTVGYGSVKPDGNGGFGTWREYVTACYEEHQHGGFWKNWYDLFQCSCLEKDVFMECYNRMLSYTSYNENQRYLLHGDFHQWNIMTDRKKITGIIDGNFMYGDAVVDLAVLDGHMKGRQIVQAYVEYQEEIGIEIPNFEERLLGAYYFKGLDGLRFYAKMGWNEAYKETRDFLLGLSGK